MKKNTLFFIAAMMVSIKLFAQTTMPSQRPEHPLPFREVSGIVKDTTDQSVVGATIILLSKKDTLKTATNADGIFIFKNVKDATFLITIQAIGFTISNRKFLNNDTKPYLVLDPIILKNESYLLSEVKISGKPSIVYKTDTVEYKASDYKVRENATVDELLKKMEGMEVGPDGSLKYQGQSVSKAKLNGKDFGDGDVAQAIKNLPADIVEKVQVVNDYGDQAARTGMKDGLATPILNLTTKAEKSVGDMLRLTAGDGNNDRYDERLFAQRINANEQLGLIGSAANTLNGVANLGANSSQNNTNAASGTAGINGSGGTNTIDVAALNYRDQWSKFIQVNASYSYSLNDIKLISNSNGQALSSFGTTSFTQNNVTISNNKRHKINFEFEYTPDSANFLRITPTFTYADITNNVNNQYTQTGFQNQYSTGLSTYKNTTPTFGALVLYQHVFRKHPGRNLSLQFNFLRNNQQQNTFQNTEIEYRDTLQQLIKDSLIHRNINRGNINSTYRTSLTYTEPLNRFSRLDFNVQVNYKGYNNNAITGNIDPFGIATIIDSLSNVYKYSFVETRITADYKLTRQKYFLTIGVVNIPTNLSGTNISKSLTINRNDFYIVPVLYFQYQFSKTQQIGISYTGSPTAPDFTQLQPVPDFTDPQNPVYGNPGLKPAFTHAIVTQYNNYIANSKLNLSGNLTANFYQDQVKVNFVQVAQPASQSFLNEIHYLNISGSNSIIGNYNISKQLDNRNYNLTLNGTVFYNYDLGMSNNIVNHLTTWRVNERFGPRLIPNETVEINPFVSYDINRTFNSIPSTVIGIPGSNDIRTEALNMEGRFYLGKNKTFTIEYNISKNYISGIASNITRNPFVTNFFLEKEFFSRKNGILRLSVFDLFDQNNFISHVATTTGYTDTKSNALSRYFSFSFILYLQKWSGIAKSNGKKMQRRGDGSFISN